MEIIKEVEWENIRYRKFSNKTWEKKVSEEVWEPTPRIRILEMLPDMLMIAKIGDRIIDQILNQHDERNCPEYRTLKKQKGG